MPFAVNVNHNLSNNQKIVSSRWAMVRGKWSSSFTTSSLVLSSYPPSLGHSPLGRREAESSSLNNLSHDFLIRFRPAVCRFPLRLKPESTPWGMKIRLFSRTVNEGTICCTINPTSPLGNIGRYLKSSSKCSHQNIGPILPREFCLNPANTLVGVPRIFSSDLGSVWNVSTMRSFPLLPRATSLCP